MIFGDFDDPAPHPDGPARKNRCGKAHPSGRYRRLVGAAVLLAPTSWIVGCDFVRRSAQIASFDRLHTLGYAASVVSSAVFWSILLYVAARRHGRTSQSRRPQSSSSSSYTLADGRGVGVFDPFTIFICTRSTASFTKKSVPWSIVRDIAPLPAEASRFHIAFAAALAIGFVFLAPLAASLRRHAVATTAPRPAARSIRLFYAHHAACR